MNCESRNYNYRFTMRVKKGKRYIAERTNKAETRPEEQSEKTELVRKRRVVGRI